MAAGGGGIVFTLIPHFLENYRSRIKVLGRYLKIGPFIIWTLGRLNGTHVSVLQNGEHVFGALIGHVGAIPYLDTSTSRWDPCVCITEW